MNEISFIVNQSPEGNYLAKAIGFAIFTEANSIEELKLMLGDAVRCHFTGGEFPKLIRMHFIHEEHFITP